MKLIASKIVYLASMLFIISVISFWAVHLAPNCFFASGELNPNITQESIENLRAIYNLDKPLYIQFFAWITNLLHLDFGISFATGTPVKEEILARIPLTITMNLISLFFIFVLSLILGITSALHSGGKLELFVRQLGVVSFAMPSFYLALILVFVFSITFPLFPISGTSSNGSLEGIEKYLDLLWHLCLPISVIVFGGIGTLTLYIRSLCIEILKSDYVFFAKARGISGTRLIRYYILPNLCPTIITLLGLSVPTILGGSVILETIFGIDGMGLLFFQSAMSHDYPVILGILIIGAFLTLLGNITADLILLKLNPNSRETA